MTSQSAFGRPSAGLEPALGRPSAGFLAIGLRPVFSRPSACFQHIFDIVSRMSVRRRSLFISSFRCGFSSHQESIYAMFYIKPNCMLRHTCASTYYIHCHVMFHQMFKMRTYFRDGRKPTSRNGNQYPAKCKCVMCVVLACAYVVYHHNIVNKQQRT